MEPVIIVHGGAGDIPTSRVEGKINGVKLAATLGMKAMLTGGSSLDAVEAAVVSMEKDEAFNAGTQDAPKTTTSDADLASGVDTTRDQTNMRPGTVKDREERVYLTGAKKRRLKSWLARGKSFSEALQLCQLPYKKIEGGTEDPKGRSDQNERGVKRNRSEEETPHQHKKKTVKRGDGNVGTESSEARVEQRETANPRKGPAFNQVAASVRIGIKDENKSLSGTDMDLVLESILEAVDLTEKGTFGPRFLGCTTKLGCIVVTCADARSRVWLKDRVAHLKPWAEASLRALEEREIPRPNTGVAWIKGPMMEPKALLHRLDIQNPELGCDEWRVLNRSEAKGGYLATFSFGDKALETLRQPDLRLFLGFTTITMRIKKGNSGTSARGGMQEIEHGTSTGTMELTDPAVPSSSGVATVGHQATQWTDDSSKHGQAIAGKQSAVGQRPALAALNPRQTILSFAPREARGATRRPYTTRGASRGTRGPGRRPAQLPSLAREHSSRKVSKKLEQA